MAEGDIKANMRQRPNVADAQRPTVTVVAGNLGLVVGQSVTLHVDLSAVNVIDSTQLMLLVLNQEGLFYGYRELDLSAEELAARAADVEIFALAEEPTTEWCQKDQRGLGTCAAEVDEGVTGLTIVPATAAASGWPGSTSPLKLASLESGTNECAFSLADCCAGAPGVQAVSCALVQSYFDECGCPDGTTSAGPHGDGTTHCTCPQ